MSYYCEEEYLLRQYQLSVLKTNILPNSVYFLTWFSKFKLVIIIIIIIIIIISTPFVNYLQLSHKSVFKCISYKYTKEVNNMNQSKYNVYMFLLIISEWLFSVFTS